MLSLHRVPRLAAALTALTAGGALLISAPAAQAAPPVKVTPVTSGTAVKVTYVQSRDVRLTLPAKVGQRLNVAISASALHSASGAFSPAVQTTVLRPDGSEAGYLGDLNEPVYRELESPISTIDVAGTWSVLLHPLSDTIGNQTVRVSVVSDVTGKTSIGRTLALQTQLPGQNARYTFAGSAGQTLVATLDTGKLVSGTSTGSTPGTGAAGISLYGPDGSFVAPLVNRQATFGQVTLPGDGTYSFLYDPQDDAIGTSTLVLRLSRTVSTAVTLGTPSTVQIAPGDVARLTFTGVKGKRLAVSFEPNHVPQGLLSIRRPNGTVFDEVGLFTEHFLTFGPLDANGTWKILIDPELGGSGTYAVTVRQPVDTVSALAYNTLVTSTVAGPGDLSRYTFQGTAGRRLAVETTKQSWSGPSPTAQNHGTLTLIGPDGKRYRLKDEDQTTPPISPIRAFPEGLLELNVSGTWTLEAGGDQDNVGSRTFRLIQLPERTANLALGTAATADLSVRGTRSTYSLTYNGSGSLLITVNAKTVSRGKFVVTTPSGEARTLNFDVSTTDLSTPGFGEAGTWKIAVEAEDPQTGTLNFTATASTGF